MIFWLLTFSYWLHLIGTAVWLGGMFTMLAVALPALRRQTINQNQWLALQIALIPWVNGSLVVLLLTGFVQMTNDPNYSGFMVLDGWWAWGMLLKHVAFVGLVAVSGYLQWSLYPEIKRTQILGQKRPDTAESLQVPLYQQEKRLLWLNAVCALLILFFTALMTAV